MQQITDLIQRVADIENITPEYIIKHKTKSACLCKYIVAWVAARVWCIKTTVVSSQLGYKKSTDSVARACTYVRDQIEIKDPHTLYILTEILCKQEKMTAEKNGGTCSPYALFVMLCKSLPSGLLSTIRIPGRTSPTGTTAIKQLSSDTSKHTNGESSSTLNPDYLTLLTSPGTLSQFCTAERKAKNAAKRAAWNARDILTTPMERRLYKANIYRAYLWGLRISEENTERMKILRRLPNTEYQSIID